VIAQIGWQRQNLQQPFATIRTDLRERLSTCVKTTSVSLEPREQTD
jgi:hypothetical protein